MGYCHTYSGIRRYTLCGMWSGINVIHNDMIIVYDVIHVYKVYMHDDDMISK